ncbi:hypothetical protein [Chromatocurvus halotolerans]|uniref:hypothetical protein n=1 Tax=Chromatocurvus halotolerans TaxID=1132028 RepID=UPI0013C34EB6|nr:hypothetical protein [Chromatocurvus halotolerans]
MSSALGWALITSSVLAWIPAAGLQYGLVYALFAPALLVWPYVSREASRIPSRAGQQRPREASQWSVAQVIVNAGAAVVVALVLPLMAGVLTVFVSFQLPVAGASQAAIGILLLPFLTALYVFLYLASRRRMQWLLVGAAGTSVLAAVMYL